MRASQLLVLLLAVCLFSSGLALAKDPPEDPRSAKLKEKLLTETDPEERLKAGAYLARLDPDTLATALDEMIKAKRKEDAPFLADLAVQAKPCHVRLLLVWAVSELADAKEIFLEKIDRDYPVESRAAIEALGFLRDPSVNERLLDLVRGEDQQIALQAARALARTGRTKDASAIVEAVLGVDTEHVRLHLVWALQDVVKGEDRAKGLLARYARKKGTIGLRAKDAIDILDERLAPVEKYEVKFATIRRRFTPSGGRKPLAISGPTKATERVQGILDDMKRSRPGYHHLFCTAVEKIRISKDSWVLNFKKRTVNLRATRIAKWDRDPLFVYYFIQYGTIMFLQQMGDPGEGHRGWEEGVMAGWRYAIDSGKIGVDRNPDTFMKGVVRDPPWPTRD